jgi:hypothetical protein
MVPTMRSASLDEDLRSVRLDGKIARAEVFLATARAREAVGLVRAACALEAHFAPADDSYTTPAAVP